MSSAKQNRTEVDPCVSLSHEANTCLPLKGDFERMARRRYQDPTPTRRGAWWTLRFRQDEIVKGKLTRIRKEVRLALIKKTSERDARRLASEHLPAVEPRIREHWLSRELSKLRRENLHFDCNATLSEIDAGPLSGSARQLPDSGIWKAVPARAHSDDVATILLADGRQSALRGSRRTKSAMYWRAFWAPRSSSACWSQIQLRAFSCPKRSEGNERRSRTSRPNSSTSC